MSMLARRGRKRDGIGWVPDFWGEELLENRMDRMGAGVRRSPCDLQWDRKKRERARVRACILVCVQLGARASQACRHAGVCASRQDPSRPAPLLP
eukprot:5509958-Pleurochrysis_carterae.AAC.3